MLPDGLRGKVLVLPHARGDAVLLLAQGVGVNRGDFEGGMSHPLGEPFRKPPPPLDFLRCRPWRAKAKAGSPRQG